MELSVVYPAYNESGNMRRTLSLSLQALRPRLERFELIVVNDCSRDDTGVIADEFAAAHPEVRVVHNAVNRGQGASLRIGFEAARYEWILHNAMDYPFDLRDLDAMLPLAGSADIIVATRRERAGYTPFRKLTSVVNLAMLRLLFPLRLRDYNFVQMYRKSVLLQLRVSTDSTAFLTPELLIRAHDLGYRITSVEVDYHPRTSGVATAGAPRVILRSVRDMLKFWVRRRLEAWPPVRPPAS